MLFHHPIRIKGIDIGVFTYFFSRFFFVQTQITSDERTQEDHQVPTRKRTLEEEDSSPIEDNHSPSPPSPPKKARSLLVSLLGQSFTDTEGTIEPKKTPYAKAEEEMEKYCKAPPLPLTEDPLNWWREHEVMFPLLSRLSKQYLCIPGTSVSAERVFSTAGDVVTAKRSALKPDHVDQLVFLQKNLHVPKC